MKPNQMIIGHVSHASTLSLDLNDLEHVKTIQLDKLKASKNKGKSKEFCMDYFPKKFVNEHWEQL